MHYLETPPSPSEIKLAAKCLGVPIRELVRTKESVFRDLGLDDPALGDERLAAALSTNPVLLERPIVFSRGRAAIGRPPEAILEIL